MNSHYEQRRPIADLFRSTALSAVDACLRWRISANAVSYASILAAAGAAVCVVEAGRSAWLLLPAVILCAIRLWLNMLDGMVALAGGQATRWGAVVNELPDRVSDALIFFGVAHSGLVWLPGGYLAAVAALLTAYVGTLGQAVGAGRQFGGWMSKPWRMVALGVGALATLGLSLARVDIPGVLGGTWTVLDLTMLVIVAGCVQTMFVRLRLMHSRLSDVRGGEVQA